MIILLLVFITTLAASEARQEDYPTPCSPWVQDPTDPKLCTNTTEICIEYTSDGQCAYFGNSMMYTNVEVRI